MNYPQNLQQPSGVSLREMGAAIAQTATRYCTLLKTWQRRYTTRRQLARAEAQTLRDVGISEAQRAVEISKPFWVT